MPEPGAPSGSTDFIGAYRILEVLGRGGMGEVFLAWDDRLKRRVAVKRIRHDGEVTPTLRQRLLREAQAVAGLNHSAIVHVYDLLEDTAGDCIVMEYVDGRTLAATLASGPLEAGLAVRLAGEIVSGLAAAHAAGIVHRDLKAENVILTPSGHAKILDFGLAKPLAPAAGDPSLTAAGFVVGTWRSMSPEQARGAEVDERSDLFSLGVLLYEMLTGQPPFRGSGPLEVLTRVLSHDPPRVDTVRTGVPTRLGTLVESLLSKEPASRPRSAEEVGRELEAIEAAASSSPVSNTAETISGLPTGILPSPVQALPRSPVAPGSTAGMSVLRRRGMKTAAVVVLTVTVLAVLGVLINRRFLEQPETTASTTSLLRVVVLRPQVNGKDERLQLAASGVLTTCLSTLSALQGVNATGQTQLIGKPATAPEMARAAAADEILVATLDPAGIQAKVSLRRQSPSGQVLWTESFPTPIQAGDLLHLAREVDKSLLRGYQDRRLRPGTPILEARTEDYAAFLAVKQRRDAGAVPSQDDSDQIQKVMDKSPGLLDARLLAADILWLRFQSTKEIALRERALDLLRGARELAPDDPRPLFTQFRIELTRDEPSVAARTLERFEKLVPGDPRVYALRSKLAERDRRMDEAITNLKTAARLSPTWENLKNLAGLEARAGRVEDARGHINQILASSPNNVFALDVLAEIEYVYGDLHQAEQRYKDLIALTPTPQRAHYTNLGGTQILLGRYQDAIITFYKALEIEPDHVDVNLNLGEAELALSRTRDAEWHFRKALQKIEKNPVPENRLAQAQCLAHLGRRREAVAIILEELEQKHENPYVLLSAAQVFALVGDHATALAKMESALKKGLQPRWFLLPAFESLRNDSEFRDLLDKTPGASLR